MSRPDIHIRAERDIPPVLPNRARDLARLLILNSDADIPVVTVVGKFNHGKSQLLNELIGKDAFSVADKRETTTLTEHLRDNVRWLDAPGLDADIGNADDQLAAQAAWLQSDIRLVVHAAKEGELDADERRLLHELDADGKKTQRQTLLVLSQADQLADDAELEKVSQAILAQAPGMTLNIVSSTRHRKGTQEGKALLVSKSGIPALKAALDAALKRVPQARSHEKQMLLNTIRSELRQLSGSYAGRLADLHSKQQQRRQRFDGDIFGALDKVEHDMQKTLEERGIDHSLTPDSAEDQFRLTAGKLERARLQIAYSQACIYLNGVLTRHGVFELPSEQQTSAASLNTVMVAVMGVSVKYRKDLHKIFCTASGRTELHRQFARYFEISADQKILLAQIADTEHSIANTDRALAALQELETITQI